MRAAVAWYRRFGRPVTVIVHGGQAAAAPGPAITPRRRVRVVQAAEPAAVARALRRRGDAVLLSAVARPRGEWLACLQYASRWDGGVSVIGARLVGPAGEVLAAGWCAPEPEGGGTAVGGHPLTRRLAPRLAGTAADDPRGHVPVPVLSVPPACVYLRAAAAERLSHLIGSDGLAVAVTELCRAEWEAGGQVVYWPAAEVELPAAEAVGAAPVIRPLDGRRSRSPAGTLHVIYVTEDTGVGGGHRDVYEHLNRLAARGHHAELWTLADPPAWFELQVPVRSFPHYGALVRALAPVEAIKVATWWHTAHAVWRASVHHGRPVYLVQDIETSYYPHDQALQAAVLAWYREEFAYMTISPWNRERLAALGCAAELIPPGIDLETFRPRPEVVRRPDMVLALGRSNPLKNLPLTLHAWRALPEPRPELVLFGIEPALSAGEPGVRYVTAPSDEEVADLYRRATVFVQTSTHEGFCLPALEAMATGAAVVCTDAHGNRGFCEDGVNCLMPEPTVDAVSGALAALLRQPELRDRLGRAGIATAAGYAWPQRIDALEAFLTRLC